MKVRLRDGQRSYQGRVEIYHNGEWGSICGNSENWHIEDANVICRMLGYEAAWTGHCCDWFGWGRGPILLDQVDCRGDESSISKCRHGGWIRKYSCSSGGEVGVTCKFTPKPLQGKYTATLKNFSIIWFYYFYSHFPGAVSATQLVLFTSGDAIN